jgi:hypothetical protein
MLQSASGQLAHALAAVVTGLALSLRGDRGAVSSHASTAAMRTAAPALMFGLVMCHMRLDEVAPPPTGPERDIKAPTITAGRSRHARRQNW